MRGHNDATWMQRFSPYAGILAAALAIACSGSDSSGTGAVGGTLIIATGQEPDALLPPLIETTSGKQAVDMLFMPIATLGDDMGILGDEGFSPALAQSWEWSDDSLSIAFRIDPKARWSDGRPVRAADVRYTLAAFRAPGVASDAVTKLRNIDSITVRDSTTFVAWYKLRAATQFFDLVYNLIPIPEHVYGSIPFDSLRTAPAAQNPVGSGKFRLVRWDPAVSVEVVADTAHWAGRPLLDRIVWLPVSDPVAQTAKLVTGEADMVEILRGAALETAVKDSALSFIRRPSFDFAMAIFNLRDPADLSKPHPIFSNRAVRLALNLSLDRTALVRNVLDTLGLAMKSPFLSAYGIPGGEFPTANVAEAIRILEEAGWRDTNSDGVRERDGRELAFSMIVPTTSAPRIRASVIMQEAFRRVGARVTLEHTESAVHGANTAAGRFDISIMGYSSSPSPTSIRQYWGTQSPGAGSNYGGYSNKAFDDLVDRAITSTDGAHARALLSSAAQVLAEDAPAIWLYEAQTVSGIHERFRTVGMRPDAWWAGLDKWSVVPGMAIDRDKIGVRQLP